MAATNTALWVVGGLAVAAVLWWGLPVARGVAALVARYLEIDLSRQLQSAVVGGLVSGLVFAAVNPFVVPPIRDAQVETGLVDPPEPELRVEVLPQYPNATAQRQFGTALEPDHVVYQIRLSNPTRRTVLNYGVHLHFFGCLQDTETTATNFGSPVDTGRTVRVHVASARFDNRSLNCGEDIFIQEFPPGRHLTIQSLVDTDPVGSRSDHRRGNRNAPESADELQYTVRYTWEYAGRRYLRETAFRRADAVRQTATLLGGNATGDGSAPGSGGGLVHPGNG